MNTTPPTASRGLKQLLSLLVIMTMLAAGVLVASPASAQAPDADGDKIEDSVDNCPDDKNRNQADLDEDGIGNKCDDDLDGDGVDNDDDLAPRNPELATDADGDRIDDEVDNCPDTKNRNQKDLDDDGRGDKCDDDLDGDGVDNDEDVAPRNPDLAVDADEDRIDDAVDNCVETKNHNQSDIDDDDIGDKCDDDIDGDDVPNDNDLAPTNPNIGLPVPCETTRTDCFSIGRDQPVAFSYLARELPETLTGTNGIAMMFIEVDFGDGGPAPEARDFREDDMGPGGDEPQVRLTVAPCTFVNSVPVSIGGSGVPGLRGLDGSDPIGTVMTVPGEMYTDWIESPAPPGGVSFNRAIKVDCPVNPCQAEDDDGFDPFGDAVGRMVLVDFDECFEGSAENQAINEENPIVGHNALAWLSLQMHEAPRSTSEFTEEVTMYFLRINSSEAFCVFQNNVTVSFRDDTGDFLGDISSEIGTNFTSSLNTAGVVPAAVQFSDTILLDCDEE